MTWDNTPRGYTPIPAKNPQGGCLKRIRNFAIIIIGFFCGLLVLTALITPAVPAVPTVAVLPSATFTIGPTATITDTPLPTLTPTITFTPTITPTLTFTPTPDPLQIIRDIVNRELVNDLKSFEENPAVPALLFLYDMPQDFSGYSVSASEREMLRIVCAIRNTGLYPDHRHLYRAEIEVVDSFGNVSTAKGLNVLLMPEVIDQINCDNIYNVTLKTIAETYDLSPLLEDK